MYRDKSTDYSPRRLFAERAKGKKHNYFFLLVTCVVFLPADHGIRKQDLLPSAPSVTQLAELKVEGIINGCQGETLGNYDIMLIS